MARGPSLLRCAAFGVVSSVALTVVHLSPDFSSLWALENELPEELMGSGGGPSLGDLGPPSQNAQQNGTTSVEDTVSTSAAQAAAAVAAAAAANQRQHQQLSQLLQSKGVAANHGSPGPKELPKQLGLVVSSSGPLLNGPPQLGAAQAAMGVRASMAGLLAAGGPNSPHQGPQSGMVGPGVKVRASSSLLSGRFPRWWRPRSKAVALYRNPAWTLLVG